MTQPTVGQQRVALVTGGNRGIGRAVVTSLASYGVDSVFTYRSGEAEADEVVAAVAALGRTAVALRLDTGRTNTFATFVDTLTATLQSVWQRNDLDYLVNNAGIGKSAPIAETTEEDFDEVFAVNVKGVFFLTQKVLPHLVDGGRIINVGSTSSRSAAGPSGAYGATKGAVDVLTRYLAKEVGARQITANVVAPGATVTGFGGGYLDYNPDLADALGADSALGRVGRPQDPGATIAALLVTEPNWITGQRIEANGGATL